MVSMRRLLGSLLPRLMCGELRAPDAEKIIEGVV